MEKGNGLHRLGTLPLYTNTHIVKTLVTFLWIFAFALPFPVVSSPVPSSPFVPEGKEPPSLRTSSTSSTLSSPSVVAFLLRPSLSSSRSSSSSSAVSSSWTDVAVSESLSLAMSRKRRELKRSEPQTPESAIAGLQKKTGADSEVSVSANVQDARIQPRRLRHSKNRASKKRPASRKRRRFRKRCRKNGKTQRRRKQRKCPRSKNSRRNGKRKKRRRRRKKQKVPTSRRRGRKQRRLSAGDNSERPGSEEAVRAKDDVKPDRVKPRHFKPAEVATLFENASPLEHLQRKQPSLRPVDLSLRNLALGYNSSQPLLMASQNRSSNRTGSLKYAPQLSKAANSRQQRLERSTAVLSKHLNSSPTGGEYGAFKWRTSVLRSSNHRTKGTETLSRLLELKEDKSKTVSKQFRRKRDERKIFLTLLGTNP